MLESHGVRHVFGVPGKGLMGFLHALEARRGRVDFVLSKHEQGGSYMAEGYARARGGLGVCLAISGGAALNLMGGVASFTVHYYPLKPGDGFYHAAGSAVMGWAVPGAIGVKLARPRAPVVCVPGDGGFLMNGMELETAAVERAAVLWVILTNRALGTVRTYQQLFRKGDFLGSALGEIDLAQVAAGLGVAGARVEGLDELQRSVARWLDAPRPTLLDVRVDPDEIPPGIMSRMKR